jgi:hypothetical protein
METHMVGNQVPTIDDSRSAGLPIDAIHRFWNHVESLLRDRHDLAGEQSIRAIMRYRNELEHVGPMLYHQSAEDVATAIVRGGYVG